MYVDTPLYNSVVYPKAIVEDAVREINQRIDRYKGVLGECTLPLLDWADPASPARFQKIDPARASHIVQHVWLDGLTLTCKVKLLSKYAEMAELMDFEWEGVPRVIGDIDEQTNECTKYTFITVDLAFPESTNDAHQDGTPT